MNTNTAQNTATPSLIPFVFGENLIRIITREGQPWFFGKDVCEYLGLGNTSMAINGNPKTGNVGLDSDEVDIMNHDTRSENGVIQSREVIIVSESGLFALIFKSRKPEARAFRKWVTSEVLPSIRKRGFYSHRTDQLLSFVRELIELGFTAKDASVLARSEFPPLTRRERLEQAAEQQTTAELAADMVADPDGELFLSGMQQGIKYRVRDFFAMLPPGHWILKKESPKGRETVIGAVMERLVRLGKVARVNARYATFRLVEESNIVAMGG